GHLAAAREQLSALDLPGLSGGQLLELVAALEIDTRQRAAITYAFIAEVDTRGVAAELGYTSTPVLLSERLRIGRREAAQRVRVAADLAPRRAMSGQPLPARFPMVAAAMAAGTVCTQHAALICRTITDLPDA